MSITPKGISVLELYRLYRTQRLIVNRRYQRKLVWTKVEKACLIESLLLNYPIPLILLGEFKNSEGEDLYEIIDGMQRLNAIFSFIENQFVVQDKYFDLTKHPFANELYQAGVFKPVYPEITPGKIFDSDTCVKFLEYSLAVTIYRANSITEIEDIFNRINSNGKHLEKIIQNIAAMANLGKGKKGYIFIGVSDKEEDTQRIEKLDKITTPRFYSFGIVGLEREAHLKCTDIDDYILFITRKIRDSKLPEWLKTATNTNVTPITYMDHTVLMIEVKAGNEPVWYGNKLYIRDGHEKKSQEVSGEQIAAVYNLFRG
jgi:hypothetical protein